MTRPQLILRLLLVSLACPPALAVLCAILCEWWQDDRQESRKRKVES